MARDIQDRVELDVPYVPSTDYKVSIMLALAGNVRGVRMADIGAGDGRIVIAFAQAGAYADGYEIDPDRVALARNYIHGKGLDDHATIHEESFWYANFSPYDIVTVYGLTSVMRNLGYKLEQELHPGAKIISNAFHFPNWQPVAEREGVYLYQR